jgi:hypothetical protein
MGGGGGGNSFCRESTSLACFSDRPSRLEYVLVETAVSEEADDEAEEYWCFFGRFFFASPFRCFFLSADSEESEELEFFRCFLFRF